MARVPAVCTDCGSIFPAAVGVREGATVYFENCVAGPCPKCKGGGKILDGVYTAIGEVVRFFTGKHRVEDIKRLRAVLELAKKQQLGREDIISRINQTTPELSTFTDCLPTTRLELYAFLTLIILIIGSFLRLAGNTEKNKLSEADLRPVAEITVNNYIQVETDSTNQEIKSDKRPLAGGTEAKEKQVGRNDPCPCGSGRKYKRCCGR